MQTQTSNARVRKILMTVDPIGGVWTYALELARALEPHGVEIALASMGAQLTREQRKQALARKNVRLFESGYRVEWMDDPWEDVDRAGAWLLQIAARFRADLIHLNGYSHAVLPWDAPVLVVAHSCVLSWWHAVNRDQPPARYDEYRRRVSAGLAAADVIVAPSAFMRDAMRFHYHAHSNCIVIRNSRHPRLFSPGEKFAQVFACGRIWDEAKNLQLLDRIAPEIEWPIVVAGDCEHPDGSTVVLPNVVCLGKLSAREIADRFSRAAIFVLPARYEPFGLSALEAALSGCALVLGDVPSLREIWGQSAIFIPPDDAHALSRTLSHLIGDAELRDSLSSRARSRALEFSPQRTAQEYLTTYRSCMGSEAYSASGKSPRVFEEAAA